MKVRLDIPDKIHAELVKRAKQDGTTFDEQIVLSIEKILHVLNRKLPTKRKNR